MNCVAVGFSDSLSNASVMRSFVNEQDVVVWRSSSGKLSAWENRCPHRGMRLSHGFVRGESLACMYHGWHYGVDGKCKYIPAHPDLEPPETIRIQRYLSFEKNGIIWVSEADNAQVSKFSEEPNPVRSLHIHCPANVVISAIAGFKSPLPDGDQLIFHLADEQEDFTRIDVPKLKVALYFIFQDLPNSKCFMHVLAEGKCETRDKKTISRSLEHLRRTAEKRFGEYT